MNENKKKPKKNPQTQAYCSGVNPRVEPCKPPKF
jgi:hypothetical protein